LSVFCVGIVFCFCFFLFYFVHQHGINVSSAVCILFYFCTMASHISGYFGLCSIRFPSIFVFPCHQFFTTAYYYYHYCYYYCNPKFWSSYYEIHDSCGILLGCIGRYQIKLVLAQINNFFFFFSFPLFSIVVCTRVYFLCFLRGSRFQKTLTFPSFFLFFLFLSFPSKVRPDFALKIFRFHSPSKLSSTSTYSFLVTTCILCF